VGTAIAIHKLTRKNAPATNVPARTTNSPVKKDLRTPQLSRIKPATRITIKLVSRQKPGR
ncbi:MAG: hypothetical protein KJO34_05960, partial [Deltaproteobacteria bacterium]|nr:hypothetical protein [Deltaproteobacteria bacterium]